jgi:enoyl-[acyl-carrier protein] reductase/trans-2-enoyl-CoA reductase (NAD+)
MAQTVINPRIRGFICLTAHPGGCAANVAAQIDAIRKALPGQGLRNVLVVGGSAGFGLSSLLSAVWGLGAKATAVAFERPGSGDKAGSAGWYNLSAAVRQARAEGKSIRVVNGDAFSHAVRQQALDAAAADGPIDLFVYSLASPKRKDPDSDTVWSSVLKPIGPAYTSQTVNLDTDAITPITINPANEAEIAATEKVMGGEDWELWIKAIEERGLAAKGFRTVAYSYIGPAITHAIYRAGTIGRAKDHLEATARRLHQRLGRDGGGAWVSVNKALVTQASSAIPVVPLYIALLFKVMQAQGTHEGTCEQIIRLYRDHVGPGKTPALDDQGRIRIDNLEMAPAVQAEVARLWQQVTTENLGQISDYAGFRRGFRQLFGFEVPGIDYTAPVEVEQPI